MKKTTLKLALLAVLSLLGNRAFADSGIDFIGLGDLKYCVKSGTFADANQARAQVAQLKGRSFEWTSRHYEGVNGPTLENSQDIKDNEPKESTSDGRHLVFPHQLSFIDSTQVLVNGQYTMKYDIVGCYGGVLTVYNVVGMPNDSTFFGQLKIDEHGLSVCDGACGVEPLPADKSRTTLSFTETGAAN